MFKNLPNEILDIVGEYAIMKYRNGIYMNQIAKTDERVVALNNYL